jgi:hypothetical protein
MQPTSARGTVDATTQRELRQVRGILIAGGIVAAVLSLGAFRQSQKTRFAEIDVERINVVEKDGKLRLTISNAARLPDPVIGGKSYPLRGGTGAGSAGLVFFNDEGNENGGLVFAGRKTATGHRANGHMTFDQFDQDEALAFSYSDVDGRARAGLTMSDRADIPIRIFADSAMAFQALPDGPEKTRRLQQLRDSPIGEAGRSKLRVFVGKTPDRAVTLTLGDPQGRARLRLTVDSLGAPALEFLDDAGRVVRRYPGTP